jgi:hypothetical protein
VAISSTSTLSKAESESPAATAAAAGAANEPATPYDATQDGFVLANDEIETHIRREGRKLAARQAEAVAQAVSPAIP